MRSSLIAIVLTLGMGAVAEAKALQLSCMDADAVYSRDLTMARLDISAYNCLGAGDVDISCEGPIYDRLDVPFTNIAKAIVSSAKHSDSVVRLSLNKTFDKVSFYGVQTTAGNEIYEENLALFCKVTMK